MNLETSNSLHAFKFVSLEDSAKFMLLFLVILTPLNLIIIFSFR